MCLPGPEAGLRTWLLDYDRAGAGGGLKGGQNASNSVILFSGELVLTRKRAIAPNVAESGRKNSSAIRLTKVFQ